MQFIRCKQIFPVQFSETACRSFPCHFDERFIWNENNRIFSWFSKWFWRFYPITNRNSWTLMTHIICELPLFFLSLVFLSHSKRWDIGIALNESEIYKAITLKNHLKPLHTTTSDWSKVIYVNEPTRILCLRCQLTVQLHETRVCTSQKIGSHHEALDLEKKLLIYWFGIVNNHRAAAMGWCCCLANSYQVS